MVLKGFLHLAFVVDHLVVGKYKGALQVLNVGRDRVVPLLVVMQVSASVDELRVEVVDVSLV
eukprot:11913335-Heterocapsa_arctica.AAC.1